MSFGFGVGDFLAILKLANDLKNRFAQAPAEYNAIAEDVDSLLIVLGRVDRCNENDYTEEQKDDVNKVVQSCRTILHDLKAKLDKDQVLGNGPSPEWKDRVRKAWRRARWDQGQINNVRSRIVSNIGLLNLAIGKASQNGIQTLNERQDNKDHDRILSWLSPVAPSTRQSEVFNSHQKGTGMWLWNTQQFQDWINNSDRVLFCPGIPGAGKTVLTSILIDYIHQKFVDVGDVGLAYFFCDYRQRPTLLEIFCALLRQLLQGNSSMPESTQLLYKTCLKNGIRPNEEQVLCELKHVLVSCSRTFVVIDALDECPSSDGVKSVRHPFLRQLLRLQRELGINILATSRPDQEIAAYFEAAASIPIQATGEDIECYIDARLDDLPSFVRKKPHLRELIKDGIKTAARDIFLLARLYFNLLMDQPNEKSIRSILQNIHVGSQYDAYDHAYGETMTRIQRQSLNASQLAKNAIGWILNAKRDLTVTELEHALAIEVGSSEFDETNITDIEQITCFCCGLLVVDEGYRTVKLVHFTTQRYFQSTWNQWFPEIHSHITNSCMAYISYNTFAQPPYQGDYSIIEPSFPFFGYAALNWGPHFREHHGDQSMALQILHDEATMSLYEENSPESETDSSTFEDKIDVMKGEHIAALFGLRDLLAKLIEEGRNNVEARNSQGYTPLFFAVALGWDEVAKLLLENGASLHSMDKSDNTALHVAIHASRDGHHAMIDLLFDNDADIEALDSYGRTPLALATSLKDHSVVIKLLARGANIESRDIFGNTPLAMAAHSGCLKTAETLLNNGAEIEAENRRKGRPLHEALSCGSYEVSKLLLDRGADIEARNLELETPLHIACRPSSFGGWLHDTDDFRRGAELLLDRGADIEARDTGGRTPLYSAISGEYTSIISLLLDRGASVVARDNRLETPLHVACDKVRLLAPGNLHTIELLLDRGSDMVARDVGEKTPLYWAMVHGPMAAKNLFFERGATFELASLYFS